MIVYDFRCANGHVFEEWFSSRPEYERKVTSADLGCPRCGASEIVRVLTAPRVNTRPPAEPGIPCGQPACALGGCEFANGD